MDLENLPAVSDTLVDKLLNGIINISNFFGDAYKFSSAKKNCLDKIAQLQYVKTLNEFEESVSLYDFYVPPHLANVKDKLIFKINSLSDIKAYRKILLSGIVGQGKSVLMRHLAISEVLEHNKIPLFYELRYLKKGQNIDHIIKQLFDEWLQIKSPKIIDYVLKTGNVTLFLDGFDEIHIDDMSKIVIGLESLVKKYPNLNFIVSSRPENVIESSTIFQNFQIKKLDFNAQKDIIKALVKDSKMQTAVISGIHKSKVEIQDALITPLMVNLFVFIYKQEQIVPEHVKDFYDRLFDLVLRKHDNTKIDFKRERATKLDNINLKKILQLISFMCCKQQVFAFDESVFRRIVEKAIKINSLDCSVDDLIFDLTSVLCFIVKEGYLYAFIHKSIPEYFAAEFIRDHGNYEELYNDIYFNYSKYEKVCIFLKIIDEYNFNNLFLRRVYIKDLQTFTKKEYLERAFVNINIQRTHFRLIFDENIHNYFKNEIFIRLNNILKEDIFKNFKYVESFQLTISSRNSLEHENDEIVVQSGVYTDYFDSISDKASNSKSSSESLERELIEGGYKKITAVNLKNKFSHTLSFLNSYVRELEEKYEKVEKIISMYQVDDFSF